MKKVLMLVVAIMLMAFATAAQAEVKAQSLSITPFIGGYVFEGNEYYSGFNKKNDDEYTLKDTYAAGLRAGYNFTENFGMEGFFSYIPTWRDNFTNNKNNDLNLYYYGFEGIYHFMPKNRLVPFVAIGIGEIHYVAPSDESNGNKFALDYGAGLKFFLTDNIALRADVRHVLPFNETYNDLLYSFGITFAFGGPPPPVEKIVEKEKIVEREKIVEKIVEKPVFIEKGRQTLDVKFDFDKAIIKGDYSKDIDDLDEVMKNYSDLNVAIEGHTDNVGTDDYNKKLSQERADAVKKYMVEKGGIDANRIEARGFGEEKPVASNDTKEGRAKNRRVEAAVSYIIKK